MRFTTNHDIPCLENEDYAGFALYMQCLAEQVEARVVADQAAVTTFLERPVAIWTETTVLAAGSSTTGPLSAPTTTYRWTPGVNNGTLNIRGFWHIGVYSNALSSAPVVNNHRTAMLYVWQPEATFQDINALDTDAAAAVLQDATWESNTGNGEDLLSSMVVYNPGTTLRTETEIGMQFVFGLATEAAGVEDVTFTSTIWAAFLGDTPTIGLGV